MSRIDTDRLGKPAFSFFNRCARDARAEIARILKTGNVTAVERVFLAAISDEMYRQPHVSLTRAISTRMNGIRKRAFAGKAA